MAILREAMDGYAEPGEMRAAVEVVKLLKLSEPGPARDTDPAEAERTIATRDKSNMMRDFLAAPYWSNGEPEDGE